MSEGTAKRSDWWIPWTFVGGFAVVLIANLALVFFATKSWTGLETRDYYAKGINYNDTLAAARAQDALGWQSSVTVTGGRDGHVVLDVRLADDGGKPLDGARVTAIFVRPTHEGIDVDVQLVAVGYGEYRADAVLALAGLWDVAVTAQRDGQYFEITERVVVEP
ncbi:MAG: FixH family protein [Alphaproteobacteria bacterium]